MFYKEKNWMKKILKIIREKYQEYVIKKLLVFLGNNNYMKFEKEKCCYKSALFD